MVEVFLPVGLLIFAPLGAYYVKEPSPLVLVALNSLFACSPSNSGPSALGPRGLCQEVKKSEVT